MYVLNSTNIKQDPWSGTEELAARLVLHSRPLVDERLGKAFVQSQCEGSERCKKCDTRKDALHESCSAFIANDSLKQYGSKHTPSWCPRTEISGAKRRYRACVRRRCTYNEGYTLLTCMTLIIPPEELPVISRVLTTSTGVMITAADIPANAPRTRFCHVSSTEQLRGHNSYANKVHILRKRTCPAVGVSPVTALNRVFACAKNMKERAFQGTSRLIVATYPL